MKNINFYLLSLIILLTSVSLFARQYPPGEGGNGVWVRYRYSVTVNDQNNTPKANVKVRLVASYYLYSGNGNTNYVYKTGHTNSYGYVALEIWVDITQYWPNSYNFDRMFVLIDEPDYSVLSSQNTTSSFPTAYGSFVVIKDKDSNGIDDDSEMSLAEKFCPILVMNHPTEHCFPEPVEYTGVNKEDLWIYVTTTDGQTFDFPNSDQSNFDPDISSQHSWVNSPDNYAFLTFNPYVYDGKPPGKAFAKYFLRFHYNFAGALNDPNGWHSFYNNERQNNAYPHTVYTHLFLRDGFVVIQYWFFYPFNDYTNNHESDWEHINVLVTSQNPQTADIHRVDYYFHERVKIVYANEPYSLLQINADSHPFVYVGGTRDGALGEGHISGGSYPKTGIWPNINAGNPAEIVAGNGPLVDYYGSYTPSRFQNLVILPDVDKVDYTQHPEMSWFKVQIPWGIIGTSSPGDWQPFFNVGNDAPPGPVYNDAWNEIGEAGAYTIYTFVPSAIQTY